MKHKKLFLLLVILFVSIFHIKASGDHYRLGYYHSVLYNEDFEITLMVSQVSSKYDRIAIELKPLESKYGIMLIRVEDLDSFVKSLKKLKSKALEWAKVVNEQNIVIEDKEIPIKFPYVSFGWTDKQNEAKMAWDVKPKFCFSAKEGGRTQTLWKAAVHTSDYDSYEGFLVSFISEEEYDRFLELLDVKKIKEIAKKRHKELDLLK